MQDFVVFSRRLAKTLTKVGFKLLRSKPRKDNPLYSVYFFEDTPELRAAIQELLKRKDG